MNCKHCGDPLYVPPVTLRDGSEYWIHATPQGLPAKSSCQHTVPYGHLAEPVGQPYRAAQPNPCLGSRVG